jgi:hypothetical protein
MKNESRLMVMGWLSKWSDADLAELRQLICEETCARERKRKRLRYEWVNTYMELFRANRGEYTRIGDTIVAAAHCGWSIGIGKSTPNNGDVFDLNTGIAVAYAKALGEKIPDFI